MTQVRRDSVALKAVPDAMIDHIRCDATSRPADTH
jgi:hypothetical protein